MLTVGAAGCSDSRTSHPPPTPSPTVPAQGYSALGDSYSSGDGAGAYLPGTDVSSDRCLRSSNAYPPLLEADRALGTFTFVACSGATTGDLIKANHDYASERAQISDIPVHTKTVTLTIGGNDAGFSSVLVSCISGHIGPITVFPHLLKPTESCHTNASLRNAISFRLKALGAPSGSATTATGASGNRIVPIAALLADIHARAPQAHVYLVGYPALFGSFSGSCHLGTVDVKHVPLLGSFGVAITISAADASWLNTVAGQLNETLETAVTSATASGVPTTFVEVSPFFEGHRLCDRATSWIAGVSGTADVKTRSAKLDASAFHPTVEGQRGGYETALLRAGVN
jgi:hypothetical protein